MNIDKRIERLEIALSKTSFDPAVDLELTEWFKVHPDYSPFAQPENNNGLEMPEHLSQAFQDRIQYFFQKRNLTPTLSGLVDHWGDIYP